MALNRDRIVYIDQLKGIAILLVVLGHLIQYNIKNFNHNVLFNIIYSFHMPLFMFLSGYMAFKSVKSKIFDSYFSFFKKKAITILLPFFTWPLVVTPLFFNNNFKIDLLKTLLNLIKNPSGGLWFLWYLFFLTLTYSLFLAITTIINRKNIFIDIILSGIILLPIYVIKYLNVVDYIDSFVLYYIFFFLGVHVSKYEKIRSLLLNNYFFSICIFLFMTLSRLYDFNSHTQLNLLIKILLSNFAIFSIYFIVIKVEWNTHIDKFIRNSGQNSLAIYVTQFPIIYLTSSKYTINLNIILLISIALFFSFIIIICCLFIQKIIALSNVLNLLLYGKVYKKTEETKQILMAIS